MFRAYAANNVPSSASTPTESTCSKTINDSLALTPNQFENNLRSWPPKSFRSSELQSLSYSGACLEGGLNSSNDLHNDTMPRSKLLFHGPHIPIQQPSPRQDSHIFQGSENVLQVMMSSCSLGQTTSRMSTSGSSSNGNSINY